MIKKKLQADFDITLNSGIRGYDDKIFGWGISVWNNPFGLEISALFWTIQIGTNWRGLR